MRPEPPPTDAPTWKTAWDAALYGPDGFFRRESPAAHFRTSVHTSNRFAEAVVRLVRDAGLDTVVDIGAGRGELLAAVHALAPDLELLGVEVARRPAGLPDAVAWTTALPESVDGLMIANEWLDNIPCHVVEMAPSGRAHVVHVDPRTGEESLGRPLDHDSVPASLAAWCERWWPLSPAAPGTRAEVGTTRDAAWADVVRRVTRGLAVAVDYGHTRDTRPPLGSLRSYRDGREAQVLPDGSRDVTAHVAVDAVADLVGATVLPQREALRALGVSGARPDLATATEDPAGYVRALSRAGEAAELTAAGGLGDFSWIVTAVGDVAAPFTG
ncbi:SAM-dependent methyltransferase [Nocardioides mesophilus]|uniref:SAM-dependent methyltransferase n=2 Tax=Nocardioides mesophilus TaxID=433659 RepID=A0A7G9RHB3_9ACTN|nr:SAM-dependent methyltransferase [Nocardioides mesophilus]